MNRGFINFIKKKKKHSELKKITETHTSGSNPRQSRDFFFNQHEVPIKDFDEYRRFMDGGFLATFFYTLTIS